MTKYSGGWPNKEILTFRSKIMCFSLLLIIHIPHLRALFWMFMVFLSNWNGIILTDYNNLKAWFWQTTHCTILLLLTVSDVAYSLSTRLKPKIIEFWNRCMDHLVSLLEIRVRYFVFRELRLRVQHCLARLQTNWIHFLVCVVSFCIVVNSCGESWLFFCFFFR